MVLFLGGGGDPGSWEAVSKEGSCFCGGLTFWGGSASKGGRLYGCPPHLRGSREVAWSAGALRASVSPLYFGEPHIVSPLSPHFRCRRGGGQPHRGYMEPLNPPPPPPHQHHSPWGGNGVLPDTGPQTGLCTPTPMARGQRGPGTGVRPTWVCSQRTLTPCTHTPTPPRTAPLAHPALPHPPTSHTHTHITGFHTPRLTSDGAQSHTHTHSVSHSASHTLHLCRCHPRSDTTLLTHTHTRCTHSSHTPRG